MIHDAAPTSGQKRRDTILLLWMFLVALALRMAWVVQYQDSPFFDYPSLDFTFFDLRARELLNGQWFSDTYLFNPLYPLFLAGVYSIFGMDLFFPRLIQALIGSVSVLLVFHIASFAFNRRSAFIAASLVALTLPLVYFNSILMATTLLVFLILLSVSVLIEAIRRRSAVLTALSGLIQGLVLLGRPNFIIPAVLLSILAARTGLTPTEHRKRTLKWQPVCHAILFLLSVAAVPFPITVYHAVKHQEFVFVAPHGGINFYIGNHEHATGTYMSIPGISDIPGRQFEDSRRIVSDALGRDATSAEVSAWWMRQSMIFIKNHPGAWIGLMLKKVALFWNAFEMPSEYSVDFDSRFHSLLRWPLPGFGLIGPLALLGIILSIRLLRERRYESLVPGMMIAGMMIAVIAFFVHARYRMTVVPWVAMYAGFAVSELIDAIRKIYIEKSRRLRSLVPAAVTLAAAVFFVHLDLVERNDLPGFYNLAETYIRAGKPDQAEECLLHILSQDNSMKTWFLLGKLQFSSGRFSEAETSFNHVLMQNETHYDAMLYLGMLYSNDHRHDASERILMRAAAADPDRNEAYVNLAILYLQTGRQDEVRDILDRLEARNPDSELRQKMDMIKRLMREKTK